MLPERDANGRLRYVAEGGWDLFEESGFVSAVVAGGGFEPPTFGL